MKKRIAFAILSAVVLLCGCTSGYGKKLYVCSSDNMIGIKGVYFSDDHITLVFDKDQAEENDISFKEDITFYGESDSDVFSVKRSRTEEAKDTIKVICDYKRFDAKDMTRISYGLYDIDLTEDSICKEEEVNGGYNMDVFIQYYDKKTDSWSEIGYSNYQLIWE